MDGLREAVIRMLGGEKVRVMAGSFQNDMTNIRSRDIIYLKALREIFYLWV